MRLQFDTEKLREGLRARERQLSLSVQYSFNEPSVDTGKTDYEQPDIPRIGGFSPEKIDEETLNLIRRF